MVWAWIRGDIKRMIYILHVFNSIECHVTEQWTLERMITDANEATKKKHQIAFTCSHNRFETKNHFFFTWNRGGHTRNEFTEYKILQQLMSIQLRYFFIFPLPLSFGLAFSHLISCNLTEKSFFFVQLLLSNESIKETRISKVLNIAYRLMKRKFNFAIGILLFYVFRNWHLLCRCWLQ